MQKEREAQLQEKALEHTKRKKSYNRPNRGIVHQPPPILYKWRLRSKGSVREANRFTQVGIKQPYLIVRSHGIKQGANLNIPGSPPTILHLGKQMTILM
jgi:hypothetical protein